MNIEKAKKILKEKAKEWFPKISKDNWFMRTTEWADGSFRVEYCHGKENVIRYEIKIHYGDIKILTVSKQTLISEERYNPIYVYESKVLK